VPSQKINVKSALKNYTSEAAYASFDEKIKGTIEPGKLADIVMLDKNIFEINPTELWDVKVDFTLVGGNIMYDRSKQGPPIK
jgi:predicted amidohydrolase YtcJ